MPPSRPGSEGCSWRSPTQTPTQQTQTVNYCTRCTVPGWGRCCTEDWGGGGRGGGREAVKYLCKMHKKKVWLHVHVLHTSYHFLSSSPLSPPLSQPSHHPPLLTTTTLLLITCTFPSLPPSPPYHSPLLTTLSSPPLSPSRHPLLPTTLPFSPPSPPHQPLPLTILLSSPHRYCFLSTSWSWMTWCLCENVPLSTSCPDSLTWIPSSRREPNANASPIAQSHSPSCSILRRSARTRLIPTYVHT